MEISQIIWYNEVVISRKKLPLHLYAAVTIEVDERYS